MSTQKILVNGPVQPGDLVTQRVDEVGPSTDNGWFDGTLVSVTREVEDGAPLDPAAVKAGDTVTVSSTTTSGAAYEIVGKVWEPSHSPGHLWVGPIALDALGVTLTDHQPAPEPEPTPVVAAITYRTALTKPGEFTTIAVRIPGGWAPLADVTDVIEDSEVTNEQALFLSENEPRALPTLEQVEVAVYRSGHDPEVDTASWKTLAAGVHKHLTTVVEADASLALLRGESR